MPLSYDEAIEILKAWGRFSHSQKPKKGDHVVYSRIGRHHYGTVRSVGEGGIVVEHDHTCCGPKHAGEWHSVQPSHISHIDAKPMKPLTPQQQRKRQQRVRTHPGNVNPKRRNMAKTEDHIWDRATTSVEKISEPGHGHGGTLYDQNFGQSADTHGGSLFDEGFNAMPNHSRGKLFDEGFTDGAFPDLHGERFDEFGWKDMPAVHGQHFDSDFRMNVEGNPHGSTWYDLFRGGTQVRFMFDGTDHEGTVIDVNSEFARVRDHDGQIREVGLAQFLAYRSPSMEQHAPGLAPENRAPTRNDGAVHGERTPVDPSIVDSQFTHLKSIAEALDVLKAGIGTIAAGASVTAPKPCPSCGSRSFKAGIKNSDSPGWGKARTHSTCQGCGAVHPNAAITKSVDTQETALQGDTDGDEAESGQPWCPHCKHVCRKQPKPGICPTCGGRTEIKKSVEKSLQAISHNAVTKPLVVHSRPCGCGSHAFHEGMGANPKTGMAQEQHTCAACGKSRPAKGGTFTTPQAHPVEAKLHDAVERHADNVGELTHHLDQAGVALHNEHSRVDHDHMADLLAHAKKMHAKVRRSGEAVVSASKKAAEWNGDAAKSLFASLDVLKDVDGLERRDRSIPPGQDPTDTCFRCNGKLGAVKQDHADASTLRDAYRVCVKCGLHHTKDGEPLTEVKAKSLFASLDVLKGDWNTFENGSPPLGRRENIASDGTERPQRGSQHHANGHDARTCPHCGKVIEVLHEKAAQGAPSREHREGESCEFDTVEHKCIGSVLDVLKAKTPPEGGSH